MTKMIPKEQKIFVRCKDIETRRAFKRVAADFHSYEELVIWLCKNYDTFKRIVPPHPVKGGIL
jgi:hypothetical protein